MKRLFMLVAMAMLFLNVHSQTPELVLPEGHTGGISRMVLSPDERHLVSAAYDNTIKIWDITTGQLLRNLSDHRGIINDLVMSPKGDYFITGSDDSTIKVWQMKDGRLFLDLKKLKGRVSDLDISSDGLTFLAALSDGSCQIRDVQHGKLLKDIKCSDQSVYSAVFSPDNKTMVSVAYGDSLLRFWDTRTGNALSIRPVRISPAVNDLEFSKDGNYIAMALNDTFAMVFNAHTGKEVLKTRGHWATVTDIAFNPTKKEMASASYDRSIRIWDLESGQCKSILKHPWAPFGKHGIEQVLFSPDGRKITTATKNGTIWLWNANSGEIIRSYENLQNTINDLLISSTGKYVFSASNSSILVLNTVTGKTEQEFSGHTVSVNRVFYSNDGRYIFTTHPDEKLRKWNTQTGQLAGFQEGNLPDSLAVRQWITDFSRSFWDTYFIKTRKITENGLVDIKLEIPYSNEINTVVYSPDYRKIITTSPDRTAKVWDAATGNLLLDLTGHTASVNYAEFSQNGTEIVTGSQDQTIRLWDARTGALRQILKKHNNPVEIVRYDPSGNYILSRSNDDSVFLWETHSGSLIHKTKGKYILQFSPDGRYMATDPGYKDLSLFDIRDRKVQSTFYGHSRVIHSMGFSPDGRRIVTASWDATCKVWDLVTGKLIYTFLAMDEHDYLNQIPGEYYQCSPNAAKLLHYVNKDMKAISFEQLDVRYNRPDKVLQAIGCKDTALIQSYRKAWVKRMKKLGIDTMSFRGSYTVPETDIINRDAIDYEQHNETLTLQINSQDETFPLNRFNLWINEVPVFGQKGYGLEKRHKYRLDTTLTIQLSPGDNRIEASVMNDNGIESYRIPLYVNYIPKNPVSESVYFIGIGIDHFSDNRYNLQYSVKDIRDLTVKLREKFGVTLNIDTLFDQKVTMDQVKALRQKLMQTGINDKVIISYSGHGLLNSDYDYFLSSYTVNFSQPEENGIPYEELENLLDGIPARKKLLLIDACHSGEVDKEEELILNHKADSMGLSKPKGSVLPNKRQSAGLGLTNSFELMRNLFVNVEKSTGSTIISAAAGNQYALEKGDLKNGVFTFTILEAMRTVKTMTVSGLRSHVSLRVAELTGGLQNPTSRNEPVYSDWPVW